MDFGKRTITALILLAFVFISIQYFSRPVFFLFLQAVILVALYEFLNLAEKRKILPLKAFGLIMAMIVSLPFYFSCIDLALALFLVLFLAGIYFVVSVNKIEKLPLFPSSIGLAFFGVVYLSFTLNHISLLREERGPLYVYYLFAVIFVGDTGAYLLGKLVGKRKMTPLASPKKTWEGGLGGIVAACLGGWIAQQVLLPEMGVIRGIVFAFIVHAVAQVSDPLESLFKRAVGVKDSSNILPGHGGILDRADSLILATPFYYYLLRYFF
ncbi:MAG: phosphatidate cytidylyltransferase [Acidobacteriota bacterium]